MAIPANYRCIANSLLPNDYRDEYYRRLTTMNPMFHIHDDPASAFPMVRHYFRPGHAGTIRQESGMLGVPLWFIDVSRHQLGVNIDVALSGSFWLDGNDDILPLGWRANVVLRIATTENRDEAIEPQIQFARNTRNPITKARLVVRIAERVYAYFSTRTVYEEGVVGRIIPQRLRLVGVTWISEGKVMPLLQIVA